MSNDRKASSVQSPPPAGAQRDHSVLSTLSGLSSVLTKVAWTLAMVLLVVLPAQAQQADEVQQQIQQLKQQYEQTTRELQKRIAALELQLKKENEARQNPTEKAGVVSAVDQAAQVAFGQGQKPQPLQGQLAKAPTYESLRDADTKIEKPGSIS